MIGNANDKLLSATYAILLHGYHLRFNASFCGAALQMSMQEAAAAATAAQGSADMNQVLGDQSFVSSVLSSVRTF